MDNFCDNDIKSLIGKLEAEDQRNTNMFKGLRLFFFIVTLIYLFLAIYDFIREENYMVLLSLLSFVIVLAICFMLMNKHVEIYSRVDYSQPTLIMLKQAKLRYRIFPSRAVGYILAILFFVGLGYFFKFWDNEEDFYFFVSTLVCSILLGVIIGCGYWVIRDKPIYDKLSSMISDLESGR